MLHQEGLRAPQSGRKPLGKLASRLEEVKNPWRQGSTLELSHNEAARLATDALLEHGEKEYHKVLAEERELNFLSPLELRFITKHAAKAASAIAPSNGCQGDRDYADTDCVSELTSGTYFPMMSDEEPPMLELGWPESSSARYGPSETQIYFQRDKSHNVKDLIRNLINKAKKVIAVVMDVFTDVDLLCDLMEASNKRRVPVYILLDEKNLEYFTDMCSALDIQNSHLSNMRIRSVCGDTYCTKSGKKFTGQVLEKFLIIDCEEVIAGSYSFTWLSAQVHSNMMMHFSGRIADSFDREFRCLYADSEIIQVFHNAEEEGLPFYPNYPGIMPHPGLGPGMDLLHDSRHRDTRHSSDHSSSQSSNSVSSVKASPALAPNTIYKVTQNHGKKDPANNQNMSRLSPDRRPPQPQNHLPSAGRLSANGGGGTNQGLPPPYGQPMVFERNKQNVAEVMRSNMANNTSKFQALGLYDHKPNMFHSSSGGGGGLNNSQNVPTKAPQTTPKSTPTTPKTTQMTPKTTQSTTSKTQPQTQPKPQPLPPPQPQPQTTKPSSLTDSGKLAIKQQRTSTHQLFNKLTDLFSPPSSKDTYNFRRSPSPQGTVAWGGPALSQGEPESEQSPPPPLSPAAVMTRQDEKRMTLGHSKLDLVNHYNKMKSKQVYSRFELKTSQ